MAQGTGLVNVANENTDARLHPNFKQTQINFQCQHSPNISRDIIIPKESTCWLLEIQI